MKIGDLVRHAVHGVGTVEIVYSTVAARVRFPNQLIDCHRWALESVVDERKHRREVGIFLGIGDHDGADTYYALNCKKWWPKEDYERSKPSWGLVSRYAESMLAELDGDHRAGRFGDALSVEDFARIKAPKVRARLAGVGMRLDDEQVLACARPDRHRLIRARAGSGKTHTLSTLAALIIRDERLNPDQVLMLAFNTKAADEIGDRVREAAGVTAYRNARTFHGLAWRLADHAGRQLVFDDRDQQPSRGKQSQFMERVLKAILNPAFQTKLYEFFRRELEQLDRLGFNLKQEEYRAFRRALTDFTLAGENVKSQGEKFIADFLFEHGIEYEYEKVYSWANKDRLQGSPYRPDFCISAGGRDLILEHWAIDPGDLSTQVPDWFKNTTTRDYRQQIVDKRAFWSARGVPLLETHTGMLKGGASGIRDHAARFAFQGRVDLPKTRRCHARKARGRGAAYRFAHGSAVPRLRFPRQETGMDG